MRTIYVLMYQDKLMGPDRTEHVRYAPYAVFDDKDTAERMKRDGDEVVEVPYFIDLEVKADAPMPITTDRTWAPTWGPSNTPPRTNDPLPDSTTKVWC